MIIGYSIIVKLSIFSEIVNRSFRVSFFYFRAFFNNTPMHKSQFLLNEVKYSNSSIETNLHRFNNEVAIPFKWGQVFQLPVDPQTGIPVYILSQSLLNEVKYSNNMPRGAWGWNNVSSQSLLNEVKYSNFFSADASTVTG